MSLRVVYSAILNEIQGSINEELADIVVGAAGDVLYAGSYLVWLHAQSEACVIRSLR